MMTEDPYGLKEIALAAGNGSKEKPESCVELNVPKSAPTNKGKANFFNRLKKTTNTKEKAAAQEKTDIKIEVTPFTNEGENGQPNNVDSTVEVHDTDMSSTVANPLRSPSGETETRDKKSQPSFTINLNSQPVSSTVPKKASKKSKIEVTPEEELAVLKEELEVVQMQLDGEEDEEMKTEWMNEIEQVTLKIVAKEKEIESKRKLAAGSQQGADFEQQQLSVMVTELNPALTEASRLTQYSSTTGQVEEDNMLSPTRTNAPRRPRDADTSMDDESKQETPTGLAEPSQKPKKKGKFR
jgi:hypothetical protein